MSSVSIGAPGLIYQNTITWSVNVWANVFQKKKKKFEPTHERHAVFYVKRRDVCCIFETNLFYLHTRELICSSSTQRFTGAIEDGEEAWRSNRRNESDHIRSLLLPPSHGLLLLPSDSQLNRTVHFSSTLRQRTPSISSVPHVLRYQGWFVFSLVSIEFAYMMIILASSVARNPL